MKFFDFHSFQKKIPFYKKIRIHPLFSFWKTQIRIFLFLISSLLFISLIFSSSITTNNFIEKIKNTINFDYHNPTELEQNITEITKFLSELKTQLPAKNFSAVQTNIQDLELLIYNLEILILAKDKFKHLQDNLGPESLVELLSLVKQYEDNLKSLPVLMSNILDNKILVNFLPDHIIFKMKFLDTNLQKLPQLISSIKYFLGDNEPHHLVILLQNNNEARSTGGFIGSFVELVINDGYLDLFKFNDIYQYDHYEIDKNQAPKMVQSLVGDHKWSLRDSNYSPDFKVSAETFNYFFEKSGGDTINTVIALDLNIIKNILKELGALKLSNGLVLDHNNFDFILSFLVEAKINQQQPKEIIKSELIPQITDKLLNINNLDEFIKTQYDLNKSYLQLFTHFSDLQNLFNTYFANNYQKFLNDEMAIFINQISISANKSGLFLKEKFNLFEKQDRYYLEINRHHQWGEKEENHFKKLLTTISQINTPEKNLKNILGSGSNHYLYQVFLPKNINNLQVKNAVLNKTWQTGNYLIAEIKTSLLLPEENEKIIISFDYSKKLKNIYRYESYSD